MATRNRRALAELSWTEQAKCRGEPVEIFYPDHPADEWQAKLICEQCPVRGKCLQYALGHHEWYGIWGGLSAEERANLLR